MFLQCSRQRCDLFVDSINQEFDFFHKNFDWTNGVSENEAFQYCIVSQTVLRREKKICRRAVNVMFLEVMSSRIPELYLIIV